MKKINSRFHVTKITLNKIFEEYDSKMLESNTNNIVYPDLQPCVKRCQAVGATSGKEPRQNAAEIQVNLIKALRRQLKEPMKAREPKPTDCRHGRKKANCKDCGGSAVCIHGRLKYRYNNTSMIIHEDYYSIIISLMADVSSAKGLVYACMARKKEHV